MALSGRKRYYYKTELGQLKEKLAEKEMKRTSQWLKAEHERLDKDLEETATRYIAGNIGAAASPLGRSADVTIKKRRLMQALRKNKSRVEKLFMRKDFTSSGLVPLTTAKKILLEELGVVASGQDVALFLVPFLDRTNGNVDYEALLRKVEEDDLEKLTTREHDMGTVHDNRVLDDIKSRGSKALQRALKGNDKDKDGMISLQEFRKCLLDVGVRESARFAKKVFSVLDAYNENRVEIDRIIEYCFSASPMEWTKLVKALMHRFGANGKEDLVHHLERYDKRLSGTISMERFVHAIVDELEIDFLDRIAIGDILEDIGGDIWKERTGKIDYRNFADAAYSLNTTGSLPMGGGAAKSIARAMYQVFALDYAKDSKAMFRHFDKNRSGRLSRREFTSAIKGLNLPRSVIERCDEVFDRYDSNHDEFIDMNEFLDLLVTGKKQELQGSRSPTRTRWSPNNNQRELVNELIQKVRNQFTSSQIRRHFREYDRANTGILSRHQMYTSLEDLELQFSRQQIEAFMDRFDVHENGRIDYDLVVKKCFGRKIDDDEDGQEILFKVHDDQLRRLLLQVDSWTLRRLFFSHDNDGNGQLSCNQFANVLENARLQATRKQINQISSRLAQLLGTEDHIKYNDLMKFISLSSLPDRSSEKKKASPKEIRTVMGAKVDLQRDIRLQAEANHTDMDSVLKELEGLNRGKTGLIEFTRFYRMLDGLLDLGTSTRWTSSRLYRALEDFIVDDGKVQFKPAVRELFSKPNSFNVKRLRKLAREHGFTSKKAILKVFQLLDKRRTGRISRIDFNQAVETIFGKQEKLSLTRTFAKASLIEYADFVDQIFEEGEYDTDDSDDYHDEGEDVGIDQAFLNEENKILAKSFDFSSSSPGKKSFGTINLKREFQNAIKSTGRSRLELAKMAGRRDISIRKFEQILRQLIDNENDDLIQYGLRKFGKGRKMDFEHFLDTVFVNIPIGNVDDDSRVVRHLQKVKKENTLLKGELEAFDANFFEQVEDLKHGYTAALARNKELESYIWEQCQETGVPPPIDRALDEGVPQVDTNKIDRALKTSLKQTIQIKESTECIGDRLKLALDQPNILKILWNAFNEVKLTEGEQTSEEVLYVISARTFANVLETYLDELSKEDVESLTKTFDKDGDGQVRFLEFLDSIRPLVPAESNTEDFRASRRSSRAGRRRISLETSLSPRNRRSISPRRRMGSPGRRSASPRRRSISPHRRSLSPSRRSISPPRRSLSPRRRIKDPLDSSSSEDEAAFKRHERPSFLIVDSSSDDDDGEAYDPIARKKKQSALNLDRAKEKLRSHISKMADTKRGVIDIYQAFRKADRNNNGYLDRAEFSDLLRSCGLFELLDSEERHALMDELDPYEEGSFSYKGFVKMFEGLMSFSTQPFSPQRELVEDRLREGILEDKHAFDKFDQFGRGTLGRKEFHELVQEHAAIPLSYQEKEDLMEMIDGDGDGRISKRDLKHFLEESPSSPLKGAARKALEIETVEAKVRALIHKLGKKSDGKVDLRSAFFAFDRDNRGVISTADFKRTLRGLGFHLKANEEKKILSRFDPRGVGNIDFPSFVEFYKTAGEKVNENDKVEDDKVTKIANRHFVQQVREKLKRLSVGPSLRRQFSRFDKNRTGDLSKLEFQQMISSLGFRNATERHINFLWKTICGHKDQEFISFTEFSAFAEDNVTKPEYDGEDLTSSFHGDKQKPIVRIALRKLKATKTNLYQRFREQDVRGDRYMDQASFEVALLNCTRLDNMELDALFDSYEEGGRIFYPEFLVEAFLDRGALQRQFQKKNTSARSLAEALERFVVTSPAATTPRKRKTLKREPLKRAVRQLGILVADWIIDAAIDVAKLASPDDENIDIHDFVNVVGIAKGGPMDTIRSPSASSHASPTKKNRAKKAVFTGTMASLILAIRNALEDVLDKTSWLPKRRKGVSEADLLYGLHKKLHLSVGKSDAEVLFKLMDDSGDGVLQSDEIVSMILSNDTLRFALQVDLETDPSAQESAKHAEKHLRKILRKKSSMEDSRLAFRFLDRSLAGRVYPSDILETVLDLDYTTIKTNAWEFQALLYYIAREQIDVFMRGMEKGFTHADITQWLYPTSATLLEAEDLIRRAIRDASRVGGGRYDLSRIFRRLDRTGKGYLTRMELARALQPICPNLSPSDIRALVNKIDSSKITLSQFKEYFQ